MSPLNSDHGDAGSRQPSTLPRTWRSWDEFRDPGVLRSWIEREFPRGAGWWPAGLSRRAFLERMGAALALAGLAGCGRPPREEIVPYVQPPGAGVVPGRAQAFATAMPWQGFARGLLVTAHLGRPTKIEGNPDHPDSLGATDPVMQASILDLYDPSRSRAPRQRGMPATWEMFTRAWLEQREQLATDGGAGLIILTEPTTSPTRRRLIARVLDQFPRAAWYQHTALSRYDRGGIQSDYDFGRADVIVSLESDFLYRHPAALRYTRAFARRRRVSGPGSEHLNCLYVAEAVPTITGSMADERLPLDPRWREALVAAIESELGFGGTPGGGDPALLEFARRAARDLRTHAPDAVLVPGEDLAPDLHARVVAINHRLGAVGPIVRMTEAVRSDADNRCAGNIDDLVRSMQSDGARALIIMDANPLYDAPAALGLANLVSEVPFSVRLGLHADETSAACLWHLPESHFLEAWSDVRAFDGTGSIVQPLIEPMYDTRTAESLLDLLVAPPGRTDYELVRETWGLAGADESANARWEAWLRTGIAADSAYQPIADNNAGQPVPSLASASPPAGASGLLALFRPDPHIWDGRFAANAWLQELPKPFSHQSWGNAVGISPALAREKHLEQGEVVRVRLGDGAIEAPVRIQPGMAGRCVELPLGFGRQAEIGVGKGVGFDAGRFRPADGALTAPVIAMESAGRREPLVTTQEHHAMEGRDLVRIARAGDLNAGKAPGKEHERSDLFPGLPRGEHRWAMVIDLRTCIGCSACVVACQAENNTPVVGPEQMSWGRDMYWIRIDRYYSGEPENPRMLHQPVPCMHCETAPCELVCPVAATVHSNEGLNEMVYNRCIGTRYCSNNCPYKVRRFNFLDFQPPEDSPVTLQKNPEVTVRARGVMEKCTYCVQRIEHVRIDASREQRPIRDGEIVPACAQACPAEAIVFGDLDDPHARVKALRDDPLNYGMLEELNTRPRTTYLARVLNAPDGTEDGGKA